MRVLLKSERIAVERAICRHFDVTEKDLRSRRRPLVIARPRQVAFYVAHKLTGASLKALGNAFGKDDGTVRWGINTITNLIDTDARFRLVVESIEKEVAACL